MTEIREKIIPRMERTSPATDNPTDAPTDFDFLIPIAERIMPAIHINRHSELKYGIQNRQQLTIPITRAATPIPFPGFPGVFTTGCC